jgi:REP element-mobilizing transposase RayT
MNRGARHLSIFGDDDDRQYFLQTIEAAWRAAGVDVHAFALMGNHYHLLMEAEVAALSAAMKTIGERYTRRFNWEYGLDGPLFRSRFHSKPITSEDYRREVIRYIHRNPVVDGIGDWSYPWSSHPIYTGQQAAPRWFSPDSLEIFGGSYRSFVKLTEPEVALPQPRGVHLGAPQAVEWAFGVDSPQERSIVTSGGKGLRNDARLAVVLVCQETTAWSSESLAQRYGYSSGNSLRTAATRARHRLVTDPAFAAMVSMGRRRLGLGEAPTVKM